MKRLIAFCAVAVCLIGASCDRENAACKTENPLEDLQWLKELTVKNEEYASNVAGYYIYQGRYDRKDVFINDICCPACMVIISVYNCNGEVLEGVTADQVTDQHLIWQSEESPCPKR